MILRDYQQNFVSNIAKALTKNRCVVAQLSTGGGKTITFSAISKRYIEKSGKAVLILVHRKELMTQTLRTLFSAFNISGQVIKAGMKIVPKSAVYVGMVDSTIKRLPEDIGLVIIDECHNLSFAKMFEHFPTQLIIGFTATPLTGNKRKPLKNYYNDIVCGIDIPQLINQGSLCQNITFAPKDTVDAGSLKIKAGEYDDKMMSMEFSKAKHIANTVTTYQKYAANTKCLIFNCSIEHSNMVNAAFLAAGLNAKHLDSTFDDNVRDSIIRWYKETPNAILNNVSILTTGFDAPDTETIIMNRATLSMPLWLQCCGRGARPTDEKSLFTIIDMGQNAITHGDWSDSRDWENIFFNPPKVGKPGVAPVKDCPQCDAIIAIRSMTCKHCGYEFPPPEIEEAELLSDFVIVTKGIDVPSLIEANGQRKEYAPFFRIGQELATAAKQTVQQMTNETFTFILQNYHELGKEWCKIKNKRYNQWHQERAKENLITELQKYFKAWQPSQSTSQ